MRYGIFSDVHGNLEALQAVLRLMRGLGIDEYFCLGDIVGYGADPGACVDVLRQHKVCCLAGNHEWGALDKLAAGAFNPLAWETIQWARGQLTEGQMSFLREMPLVVRREDILFSHGSPVKPERFENLNDESRAGVVFAGLDFSVNFIGHTHVPVSFECHQGLIHRRGPQSFPLEPPRRYLVNVGAVGQPRDGNPQAGFVVFDTAKQQVEFHRCEYERVLTQEKIVEAGLSPLLAMRLDFGY